MFIGVALTTTSTLTLTCEIPLVVKMNELQGCLFYVPHGAFVCCLVGRACRGDQAAGASGQRAFSSSAGEQTSDGVSAGSGTEAARAPKAAGRPQPGQGQDGGAFRKL